MQGYSKGSVGTSLTVDYKGLVQATMLGYSKVSLGPSVTLHHIG
jgi:hypothetical protein